MRLLTLAATVANLVITLALTLSAVPAAFGGDLHGFPLLVHMAFSGAMVAVLPVVAIVFFRSVVTELSHPVSFRRAYWAVLTLGFVTILTVFLCMLPLLPTWHMRSVMFVHGVAGFALAPTVILFSLSAWKGRKVE